MTSATSSTESQGASAIIPGVDTSTENSPTSVNASTRPYLDHNEADFAGNTNIHQRKIHQIFQNKSFFGLDAQIINKFKDSLKKDNQARTNEDSNSDLIYITSKPEGIYSLLTEGDDNNALFIKVIESRIHALEGYNTIKKNNTLKKYIEKLKTKLTAFKNNPTEEKINLINLINECDQKNNFVGLSAKLLLSLLQRTNCEKTKHVDVKLDEVEQKDKETNSLLKELDSLYKASLSESHDETVKRIIENIESAADDNNNSPIQLPDHDKIKNKDFLKLFIEEKPALIAELIYDRALLFATNHKQISNISSTSKSIATKILKAVNDMDDTSESINKFLKNLTSSQRTYFTSSLIDEATQIQIALVKKQVDQPKKMFHNVENLHGYERTINFLTHNYKKQDKKIKIAELTTLLNTTKAEIVSSFIDMHSQLTKPSLTKKNKSKQMTSMLLIEETSKDDICSLLNSKEDKDKKTQDLLNDIVGYVDYLSQYDNGNANTIQKSGLQTFRFNTLKSQQLLIDAEILRIIYKKTEKSPLIKSKSFNQMQKKLSLSYSIRKENTAFFPIATNIKDNIFIPSLSNEQSEGALLEENLNGMIKKSLGYTYTSELWSITKSSFLKKNDVEKSEITIKIEKEKADRLAEPRDKEDNWVIKMAVQARFILHTKLQYYLDVSASNPELFRQLAQQIFMFVPVLIHIFGKDIVISTLLKDISKKISEDKFLNDTMKDGKKISLFNPQLGENTDIAELMRTLLFVNDTIALFNNYGLNLLGSVSSLLPPNAIGNIIKSVAKETAKKGGMHIATSSIFYLYSTIKDDKPASSFPGKSMLEHYGLNWITTYTRAFTRIHKAIQDFMMKKPEAGKKLMNELLKALEVFAYTMLFTALITIPMVFFFNLPIIIIVVVSLILAAKIFHFQALGTYGITEHKLSLASVVQNYYNSSFAVDGHYKNPKMKKKFQQEYDVLVRYDKTGSSIDNSNTKSSKIDTATQTNNIKEGSIDSIEPIAPIAPTSMLNEIQLT